MGVGASSLFNQGVAAHTIDCAGNGILTTTAFGAASLSAVLAATGVVTDTVFGNHAVSVVEEVVSTPGKRKIYLTYAPKRQLTAREEEELKRLLLVALEKEEQDRLDNLRRELHEASKSKDLRAKSLQLQQQYEDYSELKESFSEIETLISQHEFSRASSLLEALRLNIYNARIIALLLAA